MDLKNKATGIRLSDFESPPMRAFHVSWLAFFVCFFGWFGIAPLMAVVREDLDLTKAQIGNTIVASVAITVLVRILIGPLCDKLGPRKVYSALLILGAFPVAGIGLAHCYESFLVARLAIGAIGASFVVTQYHTSMMFAPNVVGTANATAAGWGNLGGGATQMIMPLLFAGILMLGVEGAVAWRLAMILPALLLFAAGIAYWKLTTDAPNGNYDDLRARGEIPPAVKGDGAWGTFSAAARDVRVWALFVVYAACFGVELTINNIAALYFFERFELGLGAAGLVAGLYGLMNIFARTLGGLGSDRYARKAGLPGRVYFLFVVLLFEGIALVAFSQMDSLSTAIATMIVFAMFVQMSNGATFGIVPFINRKSVGTVAGIVGAGGNAGAVAAGFLFKSAALTMQDALLYLGILVAVASFSALVVRFSPEAVREHREETGGFGLVPGEEMAA